MQSIKLFNGNLMPVVGLGTWRAQPSEMEMAVKTALECGYRHIDTAFNYNTEEAIGAVLKEWFSTRKLSRSDLFLTTKLPNFGNRPRDVEKYLRLSLDKLQVDFVDLYLIHMPFSFVCDEGKEAPKVNIDGSFCLDSNDSILDTWKVMETMVEKGLAKSIGLSNFNGEQLERIWKNSVTKPAVLQVELHAYLQQKALRKVCAELNVAVTAYAPLGSPGANKHFCTKYNYVLEEFPDILNHATVQELALKHVKNPGQILLKHLLQRGLVVIPKSSNPQRIKENINLFDFELTVEDLAKLDELDRGVLGRIFDFKFFTGVENHPEYPFHSTTNK